MSPPRTPNCVLFIVNRKDAIRLLSFRGQFMQSRSLFKKIGALNIYEVNTFNILCLMFKCKQKVCPKTFKNLFTLRQKKKNQLKRSCTLFETFCKCKFSQLCINYLGLHLWNTIILTQKTHLKQSITLKLFKERLKTYLFTFDDVTLLFWFSVL